MRLPIHTILDPEASPEFERADLERFWKEVVCEGSFVHPETGQTVEIDRPRMDRWVARFEKMKEEKILPTLPYGHRNLFNDKENAGFAEALEVRQREDGRFGLWARFDVPNDDDAKRIGTTIRGTSIGVNFNLKTADGKGGVKEWGEVIDHIALTNHPVVSDTEDFRRVEEEPVPAAALSRFRSAYAVAEGDEPFVRFAHLSRASVRVSEKPWSEVEIGKLPASCHLHVGDPGNRETWRLPVFEGTGALVDGPGGGKVYARRGAPNAAALSAAARDLVAGKDLAGGDRVELAKQVAAMLRAGGQTPTAVLLSLAGERPALDVAWFEAVTEEKVPSLKELFRVRELDDQLWRATSALNEVLRRVVTSETLTGEEKKARVDAAVADFADLFEAMDPKIKLETVRAELLSLACPSPAEPGPEVRDDTRTNLGTEENDMDPKVIIAMLTPVAGRLGLSVGEEQTEDAAKALLSSVIEKLPKPDAPETEREKELRLRLERIEGEGRVSRIRQAETRVKALLERGSITKPQAEQLRKLAAVGTAKTVTLSIEGQGEQKKETVKDADLDVGSLALSFAEAIPAGLAFGRTVIRDPRPDPESEEQKAEDETQRRLLSLAGADPKTGVVGGGRAKE